jgi:hypothetical protein
MHWIDAFNLSNGIKSTAGLSRFSSGKWSGRRRNRGRPLILMRLEYLWFTGPDGDGRVNRKVVARSLGCTELARKIVKNSMQAKVL